jgi:hypothetical protein
MVSDSESSSVGKESQFETLYEQDFQALRQECLSTGTLFEDLEFLPREEFLRRLIHSTVIQILIITESKNYVWFRRSIPIIWRVFSLFTLPRDMSRFCALSVYRKQSR